MTNEYRANVSRKLREYACSLGPEHGMASINLGLAAEYLSSSADTISGHQALGIIERIVEDNIRMQAYRIISMVFVDSCSRKLVKGVAA